MNNSCNLVKSESESDANDSKESIQCLNNSSEQFSSNSQIDNHKKINIKKLIIQVDLEKKSFKENQNLAAITDDVKNPENVPDLLLKKKDSFMLKSVDMNLPNDQSNDQINKFKMSTDPRGPAPTAQTQNAKPEKPKRKSMWKRLGLFFKKVVAHRSLFRFHSAE